MISQILAAYKKLRAKPGRSAPELTEADKEVAKLTASHSESVLRQATVMRATYERELRKNPPKQPNLLVLPDGVA